MKNTTPAQIDKKTWYVSIPVLLFLVLALREISLPGLYMDSVNPDYQAAWMVRGDLAMPAWIYPDNILAGPYRWPLLNSLYGGNVTAYLGLLFFKLFGYGLYEVRLFHTLLGVSLLGSLAWALDQWKVPRRAILVGLGLLAVEPSFLYAWRTQYYLQLTPVIFLALGLGILGRYTSQLPLNPRPHRSLFAAGLFTGFAAYGYFIFAFYAALLVPTYLVLTRKQPELRARATLLAAGVCAGFSPFVYAHLSIIGNTNIGEYIQQLRGLQTAYGVVDNEQGGILSRVGIVFKRLANLRAGTAVEATIFFESAASKLIRRSGAILLAVGPLFCLFSLWRSRAKSDASAEAHQRRMLMKLWFAILAGHFLVGMLVGRPLGLQHYIMLLPVLYAMIATGLPLHAAGGKSGATHRLPVAGLILCALAFLFNATMSARFSQRLKNEGGNGMYSDVINVAVSHLNTVPPGSFVLFPQWGYWMGAVTASGPRYSAVESPSLAAMQQRLSTEAGLQAQKSVVLVLGKEFLTNQPAADEQRINDFARTAGFDVQTVVKCKGRSGQDQVWLAYLARPAQTN